MTRLWQILKRQLSAGTSAVSRSNVYHNSGDIAEARTSIDILTKEKDKLEKRYTAEVQKNLLLVQTNSSVYKRAKSSMRVSHWDLKDLESIPDINNIWRNVKAAIPVPMKVDTIEANIRPILKQVLRIPASYFDYKIWEDNVQRESSQHYPDFAYISKSAPLLDTAIDWSKFLVLIELQRRIVPKERSSVKSEWKAEYNPTALASIYSGAEDGLGQTMSWMNDYPYDKSYSVITDYRWWTFMKAERINGIWSFSISNIIPIVNYKEPDKIQDSNESPIAFKSLMKLAKAAKQIEEKN